MQRDKNNMAVLLVLLIAMLLALGCATVQERQAFRELARIEAENRQWSADETGAKELAELTEESTLTDYLTYAALNNPGLEAAFNRWQAALQRVPQERALPDPQLTYGYFIEEVETRVGPQQQKLALAQKFPWFGTLQLRGKRALARAEAEHQGFEAKKLRLFYEVKHAYYEYYYVSRAIEIAEQNLQLLRYFETVARTKYSTGEAPYSAVIKAQVELGKLEDQVRSLQDLMKPTMAKLNAALNRSADAPLPPPKSVEHESAEFSDAQIIQGFEENNPDLKKLAFKEEEEEKAIAVAKRQFYPDITLGLEYIDTEEMELPSSENGGQAPLEVEDNGKDPVIATVSINIPLWFRKYSAGVREAEARYRAATKERESRKNELMVELQLALYNYRDAGRKISLFRDTLLPKARESVRVTQEAFAAGTADFLDLIDAQRVLLEMELAYEQSLIQRLQRLAELEMLTALKMAPPSSPSSPDSEGSEDEGSPVQGITEEERRY